ncbi:MAG TPA: DUF5916 domain-containing protein [Pyrinomonadaceae bacterium]|nr:DUF5916 domain-containing protein [Pyrinomonadaceae bacterium]
MKTILPHLVGHSGSQATGRVSSFRRRQSEMSPALTASRPVTASSLVQSFFRLTLMLFLVCSICAGARAQDASEALARRETSQGLKATRASLSTNANASATKRIAQPLSADVPEGSRVTIISDAPLNDFQAYRSGENFYVRLPHAEAGFLQSESLRGRGFDSHQVERRGDDLFFSFHLESGASARATQKFNRLFVIFTVASEASASEAPLADRVSLSPTTTDTLPAPKATPSPQDKTKTASRSVPVPPEKAQPIHIARFEKPPVIDGKLDDDVWKQAPVFKDFYQIRPGDNIQPSQPTEAMIGYDARFLYIAIRAHDEPGKVRSTVAKRDNIFDDDWAGLFIDTFNDRRKAYELFFNPLGVQADAIFTENAGEDFSVDIVMESKGEVTDKGYTIEVAIPFKSLRYEAGKGKLWGVHFIRTIKRNNNEQDSWMPLNRDVSGTLIQEGHITGLENISTERTIELIPSFTVSETGRRAPGLPSSPFPASTQDPLTNTRLLNKPLSFDFGLTAKYTITPTITLDFTYNPDFAQVEADQTVVKVNQRFPIFFEEKRPFFLEGKDIFNTQNTVVHTRAIIQPQFAAKLTGKRGRNTFGLLLASDKGPGNFSDEEREDPTKQGEIEKFGGKKAYIAIARVKHDVGRESTVGMFATSYNFIERHNQLLGFDGRFKLNPVTFASFEVIGTTSRRFFFDPDAGQSFYRNGNAFAYSAHYEVSKRHLFWFFDGDGRTRDYRADLGFTRRVNTNHEGVYVGYNTEPKPKATLTSINLHEYVDTNFDWQGRSQYYGSETQASFNFTHQTNAGVGVSHNYERLFEEEFGQKRLPGRLGQFAGDDNERSTRRNNIYHFFSTTINKKYSFNYFTVYNWGAFDLDFGAGPKFPRVSPGAVLARQATAQGLCSSNTPPAICSAQQDPGPGNQLHFDAGVNYQPTNELRMSLNYTKERLVRRDTNLVVFDDNIFSYHATYQFTRFTFARARVDYDTLAANMRGQFLLGWTPNPGTAFYVGYNDDLNRNGFNPFTGNLEPGFRRNGRTFFVKLSYLYRHSIK